MSQTFVRDARRYAFFELASMVLVVNVALILWLGSGERSPTDTFVVLLGALIAGWLGTSAVFPRARSRWAPMFQRQPWRLYPDQMAGLIVVLSMAALNLTWSQWVPGVGSYPDLPLSALPDSFEALRIGLTAIVASSLTVAIVAALRLALPPQHQAEPAIVAATGRDAS